MALQKLKEIVFKTLPHPAHSPDVFPNDKHFCKHFDNFQEKIFNNQTPAKDAFE